MNLAERLAHYVTSISYDHLGDRIVQVAKQRIVDSLGCSLGAVESSPVKAIRSYVDHCPDGPSTVFFSKRKVAPEIAAFINGTMVRFLDFNDGYFALEPGHPSDNISACLAVAQAEGLSGRDLLLAIVIAYEIQMRLQDAACLFRRGWDHVNFVTVSATLAAGKLLGLSQRQLVDALGMALNGHIALRQVRSGELSSWKGASAANACRNAVFCAYLSRHGMSGPSDIFEGEMGFCAQVAGPVDLDTGRFGHSDNQDFMIMRARTKMYPTNGEMQTAVMAVVTLRKKIENLDAIRAIRVDTTDVGYKFLAKDAAKWRPTTRETADHSLPYTVARAFLDGTITRATYDNADFNDPVIHALIDKITVHEDPELAARMSSLTNRITIWLEDGASLSEQVETNIKHHLSLADEDIERKFRDNAGVYFSRAQTDMVLGLAWSLDAQPDLEAFMSAVEITAP